MCIRDRATGLDVDAIPMDHEKARELAKSAGVEVKKDARWGDCLYAVFDQKEMCIRDSK